MGTKPRIAQLNTFEILISIETDRLSIWKRKKSILINFNLKNEEFLVKHTTSLK